MTRLERLAADQRSARIWALGAVLLDPQRVQRIAAKHDWAYLCVPASALAREVYEQVQARCKPLSPVIGIWNGQSFHVTKDTLMALWRADRRRTG